MRYTQRKKNRLVVIEAVTKSFDDMERLYLTLQNEGYSITRSFELEQYRLRAVREL